ncbi:MAG TPA: hypothetical protein VKM54_00560 [Myxococcota bacterium]|nr:hypothetical protein [Myxococcota bacterium]
MRKSIGEPQHSLAAIVRAYQRHCRPRALEELNSFRCEPTLRAAVQRAALAQKPDGRRYDHQRRLSKGTLEEVCRRLSGEDLRRCRDFDQLHATVKDLVGGVAGVGELTIYDTALRIGAKLELYPSSVYLHRGTRDGARALGLDWRADRIEVGERPRELRALEPYEIEDCLCIFKGDLSRVTSRRRQPKERDRRAD